MSWTDRVGESLAMIDRAGQRRAPRDLDLEGPRGTAAPDGADVVSFASNDYLGLTCHPAVVAAAADGLRRWGAGAGSARLIVGSRPGHSALERDLAAWRGTAAATLFSTGFAANIGVITTFARLATVICSDELNHASIIDGCRLAPTPTAVYPHRDVAQLDRLLADADGPGLVVSDTVFSMDGDVAPVADLAECCGRHGALLVLDDAHAVFDHPAADGDVIRVGTLSKMLGAMGGYAAGPAPFMDLLVNRARSYIFTTALTPAATAAASASIAIVRSAEGHDRRATLRRHVDRFRPGHPSPIIPIVVGAEADAVAASSALADRGLIVPAIRPPTVPPGTSRLRVALSAAHTDAEVDRLMEALGEVGLDAT